MNATIVNLLVILGITLMVLLVIFRKKVGRAFVLFLMVGGIIIGSQLPSLISQYHQTLGGMELEIRAAIQEQKEELLEYHRTKSPRNKRVLVEIETETKNAIELAELGENSKSFSQLKKEKYERYCRILSTSEEEFGKMDDSRIQLEGVNEPLSELDAYVRLKLAYSFGRLTRINYLDKKLSTSGFRLYKNFFSSLDAEILASTKERFSPSLSLTREGAIAAGAGAVLGLLIFLLFRGIFGLFFTSKKGGS